MKSKIGLVAAVSAVGVLLVACHGFYGGGDVGVGYVGHRNIPSTATTSTTATAAAATTPTNRRG